MKPNIDQTTAAADANAGEDIEPTVIFGFDLVKLWLDRPELPIEKCLLEEHCTKINVILTQMQHHARWKLKITIFQPTIKCLSLLAAALGNDTAALVNYVEIACDAPEISKNQARRWRNKFLASARMKYQRQPVVRCKEKTTYYYGRRTNKEGKKRGNVLAIYADKASKLNNARPADNAPRSFHIEWRATGSAALAELGIVSLDDLIQFDYQQFWGSHIFMYEPPTKKKLGQLLAEDCGRDINVSDTALRKRAARWVEKYSIKGKFIMHNALLANPNIANHFKKVPFSEWAKNTYR